jgi:serine/threonine protein kinase
VYKVKSKENGELYAIKETDILKEQYEDTIREVGYGCQLKHSNIMRLCGYFIDESHNKLYQIMELGEYSLRSWFINNYKNRDYSTCRRMFCEIAAGLEYIHMKMFIHRDLKPENILISKDGTCKIADFTFLTTHHTSLSKFYHTCGIGPILYAAPEQLEDNHYDFKVDIFPMGCIMMEFYTEFGNDSHLRPALSDLRKLRIIPKKFFEKVQNPFYIYSAKNLVLLMTETDPNKRPSINEIVNHWFFGCDSFVEICNFQFMGDVTLDLLLMENQYDDDFVEMLHIKLNYLEVDTNFKFYDINRAFHRLLHAMKKNLEKMNFQIVVMKFLCKLVKSHKDSFDNDIRENIITGILEVMEMYGDNNQVCNYAYFIYCLVRKNVHKLLDPVTFLFICI